VQLAALAKLISRSGAGLSGAEQAPRPLHPGTEFALLPRDKRIKGLVSISLFGPNDRE
jgi:hypothetical protein